MELIGATPELAGKILVAYTALSVHYRVWKEHKIDETVFAEMKHERRLGIIGIVLMVVGFLVQVPTKL